jgi:8-oxo-dGTP diphosphatase
MLLATLCYLRHDGHTLMLHRVKRTDDIHTGKWKAWRMSPVLAGVR